jgi:NADH-quinone oxidoreductase subunit N
MVIGNLVALTQTNVKRMLAYSSIAHAGYLLVGLASGSDQGITAMLYYLFAYSLMNVGAFGVIAYFERNKGLDFTEVENYAGLGARQPMMAALLSVFLFSLAGIPPFAGFLGKYYIFAAAVRADMILLAVLGVLASAASVYYYLRVMVFMYFRESHVQPDIRQPEWTFTIGLFILATLTVYYGLEPLFPVESLFELLSSYSF